MKQIIVNVSGLSVEEKQRVNEALAKVMGVQICSPPYWDRVATMYVPSAGCVTLGFGYHADTNQTHTPQQVLEMAGMVEKRKVRADFDPKQPISVDVSSCTHREKCEVQQAFFDVGITWFSGRFGRESEVTSFRYLDAEMYTNSTPSGTCHGHLMYRNMSRTDSISHQQFLDLVYEPEQQGHVHAHLMAQYAEDAKTTDKPWELWQLFTKIGTWVGVDKNPDWCADIQYRRKPKTHIVNGVEVPDLRIEPKVGDIYYLADPTESEFTYEYKATGGSFDSMWIERGLCYKNTEEGKQAAILHAKAMLGIA